MRVGWTGHRPWYFASEWAAQEMVDWVAEDCVVNHGADLFVVGGQRGVDTWAAQAAMRHGVPYLLLLPFPALDVFTRGWSIPDMAVLYSTIEHAQEVRHAKNFLARNRAIVHASDVVHAVWTGRQRTGTSQTIGLAKRAKVPLYEHVLEPRLAKVHA